MASRGDSLDGYPTVEIGSFSVPHIKGLKKGLLYLLETTPASSVKWPEWALVGEHLFFKFEKTKDLNTGWFTSLLEVSYGKEEENS